MKPRDEQGLTESQRAEYELCITVLALQDEPHAQRFVLGRVLLAGRLDHKAWRWYCSEHNHTYTWPQQIHNTAKTGDKWVGRYSGRSAGRNALETEDVEAWVERTIGITCKDKGDK